MKKTFMSLAVTALLGLSGVAASAAPVYPDFTVNEGSVTGAANNVFTADKMNGGYNEIITLEAGGPSPTGLVFSSAAYVDFGAFFKNDGASLVPAQISGFGSNNYGLYGIFYSEGVVTSPTTFTGTSGEVRLFIDPNQDTVKTLVDSKTVSVSGDGDDYEIAFSLNLTEAVGNSANPAAFNFVFANFTLTDAGKLYFTAPSSPFYQFAIVNGDFDNIAIAPGTTVLGGDVSAVFSKIPEPGSLALLGLGLAGLGFTQRRRNQAK
jgi:hypothetical protein